MIGLASKAVDFFGGGYVRIAVAVAVVALVALAGWRVSAWHEGYLERDAAIEAQEAAEKRAASLAEKLERCSDRELAAASEYAEASRKAAETAAADRETAKRIEHELQARLADSDARGRDLSRRLRDYQTRAGACAGALPSRPAAPGVAPGAAPQSGNGEAVERAVDDHFAACALDAEALSGWQAWWREVSAGR